MSERPPEPAAAAEDRARRGVDVVRAIIALIGRHVDDGTLDGTAAIIAAAQATGVVASMVAKPGHLRALLRTVEETIRESAELHMAEKARRQ